MKKLLLSIAILTSFSLFAQKDLMVTMTTPVTNQTIVANTPFNIGYSFKNNGTVAIAATDSVVLGVVVGNQVVYAVNVTHGGFTVGETKTGALNNFSLNFTTAVSNVNFCLIATLRYSGNLDSNTSNNISCATVNMALTGVEELAAAASVKVYPNPASGVVHFEYNYNKNSEIRVFDITGKRLDTFSANNGEGTLDISTYNNGIYMYEIVGADNQTLKTGRFNVTH